MTIYKPVSKNVAMEAVPFNVRMPEYFPFNRKANENVEISKWTDDDKIILGITYHSTDKEKESIEYIMANFDRFYSEIKTGKSFQKVNLDGGTTAYYKITAFPSAEIHWWKDGMEYSLHHTFYTNNEQGVKKNLVKMAESIH